MFGNAPARNIVGDKLSKYCLRGISTGPFRQLTVPISCRVLISLCKFAEVILQWNNAFRTPALVRSAACLVFSLLGIGKTL